MKIEFVPSDKPGFNFRLILKILTTAALLTAAAITIANFFFLEKLAETKIAHLQKTADLASTIVSELALPGLEDRDETKALKAVRKSLEKIHEQQPAFLNISIILYPEGVYYASSDRELSGKKAGQNLRKKIELNRDATIEKLNYKHNNKTIPVLHFLKNIYSGKQGETKRVAVSQVLFDYGEILRDAKESLWKIGGALYFLMTTIITIVFLPISRAHRELTQALNEVSRKNFEHSLPTRGKNEIGVLFNSFNRMTAHLRMYFQKTEKPSESKAAAKNNSWNAANTSLRKSEVSCLCVRLPEIRDYINNKPINSTTVYINKFLQFFDKGVREFGGRIVKVMGDKVYAVFESVNSVDNSIKAALKLNRKWRAMNHENKVLNVKQKNYGMGLHHEKELAGTVADPSFGYTFVGQATDIAGHLCSLAEKEQILISSSMTQKASGTYSSKIIVNLSDHPYSGSKAVSELIVEADVKQELYDNKKLRGDSFDADDTYGDSFDPSLASMLEETLKLSPLESLESKSPRVKQPGADGGATSKNQESLWDQFDSADKKAGNK